MSDTRENIVDKAEELIRTKGYNAFSYGDIAGVLHIRNAAIHYYFPSKADLGVSVVDREIDKIASSREEWGGSAGECAIEKGGGTILWQPPAGMDLSERVADTGFSDLTGPAAEEGERDV